MRIISVFHTFVVLIIGLTFSTSFVTFAQQNPILTEVSKTAAAQKANAMKLEIKAAAEREASNDTNKYLWFCIGAGGLPVTTFGCALLGDYFLNPVLEDSWLLRDKGGVLGGVTGLVSYTGLLPRLLTFKSTPPPERLIGKSPAYVYSYLNAYKRRVETLRTRSLGVGCILGCGLTIAIGTVLDSK
ncbi:hypothetical protein C6503_07510 [Candidatus Poribacteria bacterium]|nr:MAG: hypothetical protein C6503_07510 [Candidatus Poribacteria bacterium]